MVYTENKSLSKSLETGKEGPSNSMSKINKNFTAFKDQKSYYDVVVIGSGGAGLSSAIVARSQGLTVLVVEQSSSIGGNTLKASSGMNASNTQFQKEKGIKDSNDLFYLESLKAGKGTNDIRLLKYLVDHSAESIDWLDSLGIRLDNPTVTGGMTIARTHRPSDGSAVGPYLIKGLIKQIGLRGVDLLINTQAVAINQKDGKVNGVKLKHDNFIYEVKCGAVIIGTGGFGANYKLIRMNRPDLMEIISTNHIGSQGSGLDLVKELGGVLIDLDKIQIHPTVHQERGVLIAEAVRGEGAILVNKVGKRFVNELTTRDTVSQLIQEQVDQFAYLLFDNAIFSHIKAMEYYCSQGYIIQANSLSDLAYLLNMNGLELNKTVANYNKAIKLKQMDKYERGISRYPIVNAPYYAIRVAPGIHYTMGGVKINKQTEVLNEKLEAIPGLFAAGEVVGGLHGSNRLGGNSIADIIIYGRQAGRSASEYIKLNK